MEKEIDAGAVARNEWPVVHANAVTFAKMEDRHLPVARGDKSFSRSDDVAVLRFFDVDLANVIEPLGKGSREMFRHMLNHHDARRILGHCSQNCCQSFRSTG